VRGEPVDLRPGAGVLQGAVVDVHPGVVADRPGLVGLPAEAEVALGAAEDHAVEVVDGQAVVGPLVDDPAERTDEVVDRVEAQVPHLHVVLHGLELDAQPGRIAEAAVGVREAAVEICVLALGAGGDHRSFAGQDVHLQHGLVRQPAAEGARLDAQPRHRAAQGDGLQLRHHERRQPVGQRRVNQVFVGAHARHVRGARPGVDGDDPGQAGDVQARGGGAVPGPEQVRRLLGQPHALVCGDGAVAGHEPRHGLPVLGLGARLGHDGPRRCRRFSHSRRLCPTSSRRQAVTSTGSPTLTCPALRTVA
jgi:hypothetical protein